MEVILKSLNISTNVGSRGNVIDQMLDSLTEGWGSHQGISCASSRSSDRVLIGSGNFGGWPAKQDAETSILVSNEP